MLLRDNGRACTFGEPCSTTDKQQHQERPQQTTKRGTSGDTTDPVASTAAIPPKQRHPPKPPRPTLPTPNHKRYLLKASRRHHKRYPLEAVNAIPPPHRGRQRHPPKAANARPPPPPHRSRQRSPLVATNPDPQPTNGTPSPQSRTLSPRRHQPCTTTNKRQTQERPQKTTKRWTIGSSGGGDNDVSDCKTTRQSTYTSALVPPIRCCPAEAATTMAPIR